MTKNYKIAVPVFGKDIGELLRRAGEAIRNDADILEFRLDFTPKLGFHDVSNLGHVFVKTPKIFTNRHKEDTGGQEGFGFTGGNENERLDILRYVAIANNPDFIDIEHKHTKNPGFRPIQKHGKTKVIVSHHNFHHTPSYDVLRSLYDEIAARADCDIVKIATKVHKTEDNDNLFRLIEHASHGGGAKPIVAVGMGERISELTRYDGPKKGSLWTYGAISRDKQSAPGQVKIEDLRHYWKTGEMR